MASGATPRRERRRRPSGQSAAASTAASNSPDITTPAAPAETDPIGSLSLGGEASPRAQQEAAEMIASIQNRLSNLSAGKVRQERSQVSRIRNFRRQAQDALNSGDVEGAKTLATKARLLLDDLEK
jgi:ribosomal protein S20